MVTAKNYWLLINGVFLFVALSGAEPWDAYKELLINLRLYEDPLYVYWCFVGYMWVPWWYFGFPANNYLVMDLITDAMSILHS